MCVTCLCRVPSARLLTQRMHLLDFREQFGDLLQRHSPKERQYYSFLTSVVVGTRTFFRDRLRSALMLMPVLASAGHESNCEDRHDRCVHSVSLTSLILTMSRNSA